MNWMRQKNGEPIQTTVEELKKSIPCKMVVMFWTSLTQQSWISWLEIVIVITIRHSGEFYQMLFICIVNVIYLKQMHSSTAYSSTHSTCITIMDDHLAVLFMTIIRYWLQSISAAWFEHQRWKHYSGKNKETLINKLTNATIQCINIIQFDWL